MLLAVAQGRGLVHMVYEDWASADHIRRILTGFRQEKKKEEEKKKKKEKEPSKGLKGSHVGS